MSGEFFPRPWRDSEGKLRGFCWQEIYEDPLVFGEPIIIEVNLFGRIRTTDSELLNKWITLPKEERMREQKDFLGPVR